MSKVKKQSGFTLVEMVVYVAFFAILSVVAVNAVIMVMRSFYALRITQTVGESATTALERMSREIRNAYDYDSASSTLATSPGKILLRTKDNLGVNTTIEFSVDASNQLVLKEGGVNQGPLVAKTVTVSDLIFRVATSTNSKAVKIEMSLHDTRADATKVIKFYDTIVMRGSVH